MDDGRRVSVLDAIIEYRGYDPSKILLFSYITISLISMISSLILITYTEEWTLEPTSWIPNYSSHSDYFTTQTSDCFYISILQFIILTIVAYRARYIILFSSTLSSNDNNIVDRNGNGQCGKCFKYMKSLTWKPYSSLPQQDDETQSTNETLTESSSNNIELLFREQLKSNGKPANSSSNTRNNTSSSTTTTHDVILEGYEEETKRLTTRDKTVDDQYLQEKQSLTYKLGVYLFILFLISSSSQVYIGLKCISFLYKNEAIQGTLMGLNILWVNIMTWLLKSFINKQSKEDGEFIPTLHCHRLHLFSSGLLGHFCDLCGKPCNEGRAFRCKLCDFDLCLRCYNKKDKLYLEGQIRGDSGIKTNEILTSDKYFLRAIKLVFNEYKIFMLAMLCLLINNGLMLMSPWIQGSVLNAVVGNDFSVFDFWVKLYLISSVCSGLFGGIQSLCFNIVGRRLSNNVKKQLYRVLILQDVAFFDGNSTGQLTSRLTNDVSFMLSPVQSMMGSVISNIVLLIGGVSLCFITSWRLSMLAFTTVGPIIHIAQLYAGWSQKLNGSIYTAMAIANGYANEALGNIRTVKSFSMEKDEMDKFNLANDTALLKGITDAFGGAGMYTINTYLEMFASIIILWYGGKMVLEHDDALTAGQLITYQLYWNMLNNSYKSLLDTVTSFTRASSAAQRVFSLLDSAPDIDLQAGIRINPKHIKGEIILNKVDFTYQMRPDTKVLNSVSLHIPAGTTCAFVGKSGGGKSTLINMLLRFYDPNSGNITIDGMNLKDICLSDYRQAVGLVQQNTELFGGTIEENITYGMEEGSWRREDAIEAARHACAHEFIKDFPEGYMTRVGERGVRISGGQKQRIAIARVFLRQPRILLLDEATSALDAVSEAKVQEALDKLMSSYVSYNNHNDDDHNNNHDDDINIADTSCASRGSSGGDSGTKTSTAKRTIILVAHRLSTVMNADQIVVISNGSIVEAGTHESLLRAGGEYHALVQKQIKKMDAALHVDNDNDDQ